MITHAEAADGRYDAPQPAIVGERILRKGQSIFLIMAPISKV